MMGKLIVFEGGEGAGKSTQIKFLKKWVETELGKDVISTFEPGGTLLGSNCRKLLTSPKFPNICSIAELLLYATDRAQHVAEIIKPSLAQGKIVLCDRYIYSTIAYQGFGRELDLDLIDILNAVATQGINPDIVFWIDINPRVGLERKAIDKKLDKIELEDIEFHQKIRKGYQSMYESGISNFHKIDGEQERSVIRSIIQQIIRLHI